jgi:hypothetical protein
VPSHSLGTTSRTFFFNFAYRVPMKLCLQSLRINCAGEHGDVRCFGMVVFFTCQQFIHSTSFACIYTCKHTYKFMLTYVYAHMVGNTGCVKAALQTVLSVIIFGNTVKPSNALGIFLTLGKCVISGTCQRSENANGGLFSYCARNWMLWWCLSNAGSRLVQWRLPSVMSTQSSTGTLRSDMYFLQLDPLSIRWIAISSRRSLLRLEVEKKQWCSKLAMTRCVHVCVSSSYTCKRVSVCYADTDAQLHYSWKWWWYCK